MDIISSSVRKWLETYLFVVLVICLLLGLASMLRQLISAIAFFRLKRDEHPDEFPMPKSVWIGMTISIVVACAALAIHVLLQFPSLWGIVLAIVVALLGSSAWYGIIESPRRNYREYLRRYREQSAQKSGDKEIAERQKQ
jgi:hypothetical protein